jgi:magnesium transporter
MRTSSRHPRAGASPGTLIAHPEAKPPLLRAFAYGPEGCEEKAPQTLDEAAELRGRHGTLWLNIDGLGDLEMLRSVGSHFGLHDLALEDVLAVHHRAKLERYEGYLFVVLRMPEWADGAIATDQLSLFVGPDYVLSFQQRAGDCFDAVRDRIRGGKGRIRHLGSPYLFHALLDAVVDSYYPVLEKLGDRLEHLEDRVMRDRGSLITGEIHRVRRDLLVLRRAIWPLREIVNELLREEDADPKLAPFLRDCYDHVVELVDLIETYRDLSAGLMEVYVSVVGNRMNEIMKVLTIIATIFIPLSFIASVYGMNFDTTASPLNMPELGWRYGYAACMGFMTAVAIGMLVWFKRKGWLSDDPERRR